MTTSEPKYYKELEAKLERYIGVHKMRHTAERYTILRYVCEIRSPFTADQVIEQAKKDFISQPTVYNTLQLLVSAQILWEVGKNGNCKEYELITSPKMRMRIRCTRCGRIDSFKDSIIENQILAHRYRNFNLTHFTIDVWGVCRVCGAAEAKKKVVREE